MSLVVLVYLVGVVGMALHLCRPTAGDYAFAERLELMAEWPLVLVVLLIVRLAVPG